VGSTVVWFNADKYNPHGVQSIGRTSFGSAIPYGGMYNVTFNTAGTYYYVTKFQPQLHGTIVVS
jgi:plastocyanin